MARAAQGGGGVTISGGVQEPWRGGTQDVGSGHGGGGLGLLWGSESCLPALVTLRIYEWAWCRWVDGRTGWSQMSSPTLMIL